MVKYGSEAVRHRVMRKALREMRYEKGAIRKTLREMHYEKGVMRKVLSKRRCLYSDRVRLL